MTAPIFEACGDRRWRPAPVARGPFEGVQGGAVAGLLCAAAEAVAGSGYIALASSTLFLRPTPMAELEVVTTVLQQGRRATLIEATVSSEGRAYARSTVTLASEFAVPEVVEADGPPADPASLPRRPTPSRHGAPWLMDVMEARAADPRKVWFRFPGPITGAESAFARMLAAADWVVGVTRPDSWDAPIVRGIPNVELSVHASRHPRTDWTGVEGESHWRRSGTGLATGRLFDEGGLLGQVNATVILAP